MDGENRKQMLAAARSQITEQSQATRCNNLLLLLLGPYHTH